jgi:hypothetical protein
MEEWRKIREKETKKFISTQAKSAFEKIAARLKNQAKVEIESKEYSVKITITPEDGKPFSYTLIAQLYRSDPKFPDYPLGRVVLSATRKVGNNQLSDIPLIRSYNYTASEITEKEIINNFETWLRLPLSKLHKRP